jgi:pantothenate kinase type III
MTIVEGKGILLFVADNEREKTGLMVYAKTAEEFGCDRVCGIPGTDDHGAHGVLFVDPKKIDAATLNLLV